jgi:hypothetical protein
MENFRAGDLRIDVVQTAQGGLMLVWRGKSNDRQPARILRPFFDEVDALAQSQNLAVTMHFEALEHFNSSTITALIQIMQSMRQKGVKLTVFYNGELKWQKLSFEALRIFEKQDGLLKFQTV